MAPATPSPHHVEPREVADALTAFVNANIMADGHSIAADDALGPAGVDSMAMLKIFLFIEAEYGFWIPDEDLVEDNVGSLRALARYVSGKIAP